MRYNTLIIIVILIFFFILLLNIGLTTHTPKLSEKYENNNDTCTSCSNNKNVGENKLLPIMDPHFNMREICKNSILLEDHLFQKEKQCQDCIKKHMLTMEALAEEMITLDKDGKCKEYYDLPKKIRALEKQYIDGRDRNAIAQEFRKLRKNMVAQCFDKF